MSFNFVHPFGFIYRFPPVGLSTTSCLDVVSMSEFLLHPCASQQLPACIWFQYLGFPWLSTTSCAHLVSISNLPPWASHQTSQTSCIHWVSISMLSREQRPSPCDTFSFPPPSHSALFFSTSTLHTSSGLSVAQGLNLMSTCVDVPHLGAFIWFQYLNFPPWYLSAISCTWSQGFPSGLLTTFCMHFNLVSISRLPPCLSTTSCAHLAGFNIYITSPLCLSSNFLNFLHSLGFNVYALQGVQRPSPCDALGFPPPSCSLPFSPLFLNSTFHTSVPHLGAFIWFQYLNFPPLCLSAISCIHSLGLKTSPLAS